jgi:hypothetical protein
MRRLRILKNLGSFSDPSEIFVGQAKWAGRLIAHLVGRAADALLDGNRQ